MSGSGQLYNCCMAGSSGSTSGDRDHNGGTYNDLGSRRCAGGTDPEYSGCTVCRTGGCIFYCDNFTACIYQTICNAFY